MSGPDPNEDASQGGSRAPGQQQQPRQPDSAPFQSQLEYLSQQHPHQQQNVGQYGQQPFDMAAMAGALPQAGQHSMTGRPYGTPDLSQGMQSQSPYQPQQAMFPQGQRPQFADPTMLARAQQQQLMMGAQYGGPSPIQRQQGFPMGQVPYSPIDPYGYAMGQAQFSPIDPRFAAQQGFMMPGLPADIAQFARRGSAAENAPIPNYPRGPPRKPKQSGHALWVGNLPPAARVTDLKDHFSRDATTDIESVFLIAKSNCAFVNYRTEAACVAAMNRFHDSRFHGVRLVCRLRRGTTTSASTTAATPTEQPSESEQSQSRSPIPTTEEEPESPTIARSRSGQDDLQGDGVSPVPGEKVPEKYFIVKSLTAQDLEASVRNGIWATQSHNETILNRAYDQAENVYLIFSANKSGEYFGYARMASAISGEPVNLSQPATEESTSPDPAGAPQSIATPATATAPKGRIIDDTARGTIFWEADHSDNDDEGSPEKIAGPSATAGNQNWGKQFQIEWVSTNRLPFYRTRGLRNPWNANREVKIARDGTELEPNVGRRLVQMFHRPSPSSSAPPPGPPNMQQGAPPQYR